MKPCPRLELEWKQLKKPARGIYEWECVYSLVIPLDAHDIRREGRSGKKVRSEQKAKLGRSLVGRCGRPPLNPNWSIDTPWRDGCHAQWDSVLLGDLPVVVSWGDMWHAIPRWLNEDQIATQKLLVRR